MYNLIKKIDEVKHKPIKFKISKTEEIKLKRKKHILFISFIKTIHLIPICFVDNEYKNIEYKTTNYKILYNNNRSKTILNLKNLIENYLLIKWCMCCKYNLTEDDNIVCTDCYIINSETNGDVCSICYNIVLQNNFSISICNNKHLLHLECYEAYNKNICPVCIQLHECNTCLKLEEKFQVLFQNHLDLLLNYKKNSIYLTTKFFVILISFYFLLGFFVIKFSNFKTDNFIFHDL